MNNKVLLLGCDGNAGMNYAKSLLMADSTIEIIGTGFNKYHLSAARSLGIDTIHIEEDVWDFHAKISFYLECIAYGVDFIHAQPEQEVRDLARMQDIPEIAMRTFGKNIEECNLFDNKDKTLERSGIEFYTYKEILSKETLFTRLLKNSSKAWIRAKNGAGSKWALPITSFDQAKNWVKYLQINKNAREEDFIISEFLPGPEFAVQLFYIDGELYHCQARERVEHHFAKQMVSGQSSTPSIARTVDYPEISFYAASCVLECVERPNGIYGVDMKCDQNGRPVMTEINYGRYYTTNDFFSTLGVNTPYEEYMYVKSGILPEKKIDSITDTFYWIRGLDHEPVLMEDF